MKIITGNTGEKHVTSEDDGTLYASIVGKDDYILDINENFSHEVLDTNTIRINSGDALLNDRQVRIPRGTYDLVSIDNGQTGYKRIDLIVIRYESNKVIEKANLVVIKGTATTGTATAPDYQKESILDGALIHDVPLYEVHLDGINLEKVVKVFIEKKLSVTNLGYRPNLLINGDFQVNQYNFTSLTMAGNRKYFIDRWLHAWGTSTITKVDDGIKIINTSNSGTPIEQCVECNINQTLGKKLTLSASVDGVVYSTTNTLSEVEKVFESENFGMYFRADASKGCIVVRIYALQSKTITINWVKLEQGSVATPFVPRLYAEELALCHRYYEVKMVQGNINASTQLTSGYLLVFFNLTPKRKNPQIQFADKEWVHGYVSRVSSDASKHKQNGRVYIYPDAHKNCGYELISDSGENASTISAYIYADAEIY